MVCANHRDAAIVQRRSQSLAVLPCLHGGVAFDARPQCLIVFVGEEEVRDTNLERDRPTPNPSRKGGEWLRAALKGL